MSRGKLPWESRLFLSSFAAVSVFLLVSGLTTWLIVRNALHDYIVESYQIDADELRDIIRPAILQAEVATGLLSDHVESVLRALPSDDLSRTRATGQIAEYIGSLAVQYPAVGALIAVQEHLGVISPLSGETRNVSLGELRYAVKESGIGLSAGHYLGDAGLAGIDRDRVFIAAVGSAHPDQSHVVVATFDRSVLDRVRTIADLARIRVGDRYFALDDGGPDGPNSSPRTSSGSRRTSHHLVSRTLVHGLQLEVGFDIERSTGQTRRLGSATLIVVLASLVLSGIVLRNVARALARELRSLEQVFATRYRGADTHDRRTTPLRGTNSEVASSRRFGTSIRLRIALPLLMTVLVSVLALQLLLYPISRNAMQRAVGVTTTEAMERTAAHVGGYLQSYTEALMSVALDRGLQLYLSPDVGASRSGELYSQLGRSVSQYLAIYPDISNIRLFSVSLEPRFLVTNDFGLHESELKDLLGQLLHAVTEKVIRTNATNIYGESVVRIGMQVRRPSDFLLLGHLIVDYRIDRIARALDQRSDLSAAAAALVDGQDRVVHETTEWTASAGEIADRVCVPGISWQIRFKGNQASTDSVSNELGQLSVTTGLALAVAGALIVFYFSGIAANDLRRLEASIASATTGTVERVHSVGVTDEIERIRLEFNAMVDRIDQLVQQTDEQNRSMREIEAKLIRAELRALQYQVNPHFLHNTLESIRSLVGVDDDRARRMVTLLGRYFRSTIEPAARFVPVQDEIANAQLYASLQEERLNGKPSLRTRVPPQVLPLYVPRLILQPIIENSLLHGLPREKQGGTITIDAWLADDALELRISDDGVGSTADGVDSLNRRIQCGVPGSGIGLPNVHERIRLEFGDPYGISVHSPGPGTGFETRLLLPALLAIPTESVATYSRLGRTIASIPRADHTKS